jgi:hypothetical protein
VATIAFGAAGAALAHRPFPHASADNTPSAPAVVFISNHGYPELRVEGQPFFIHAAEFDYYRIPRDLWADSLDRYRGLGINTIDLRIPWNWHEPHDGEFDFDGHTNPRRDLRGLLAIIQRDGFRLIARPGPVIGDQWKFGGYPEWLIDTPELHMSGAFRAEGLYPPAEGTMSVNADAGAQQWLTNAIHMRYAAAWLAAVAHELAPYNSSKTFTVPADPDEKHSDQRPVSGPLLFVILDDSAAIDAANPGDGAYFRYVKTLREALVAGGIDARFAITAAHSERGFEGESAGSGLGVTGEWFLTPPEISSDTSQLHLRTRLADADAESLALMAQSLRLQTDFPALLSDFQASWFAPADDSGPAPSPASNTLLSSRWLMAQGVKGLEYSPLQDTLSPPGYQVASANREYRWDAAFDLTGQKQPRAIPVERNGRFLDTWGEFLASAHPRTNIALIDWRAGIAQLDGAARADTAAAANSLPEAFRQVERIGMLAGFPMEMADPADQPADLLLREPILLLLVPERLRGKVFLPEKSQSALIEYVNRGGVLICNPELPRGSAFDEALRQASPETVADGLIALRVGQGRVVTWSKDFYSWEDVRDRFAETAARQETAWAVRMLQKAAAIANLHPVIQPAESPAALLTSELVPDDAGGPLGSAGQACVKHPFCEEGLLSVANWSGDEPVLATLKLLPPTTDSRLASESDYIQLPVYVAPEESLLLPLEVPLCALDAQPGNCNDRIVASAAELLNVNRDGKTLKLLFHAPANATVLIKLRSAPSKVDLSVLDHTPRPALVPDDGEGYRRGGRGGVRLPPDQPGQGLTMDFPARTLEGSYDKATGVFTVVVPRGAAPDFLQEANIHLNYAPDIPEREKPPKNHEKGYTYSVADAVRLPLGTESSLPSMPPVILLDKDRNGQLVLETENLEDSFLTLQATVDGPVQGTDSLRMADREDLIETVKLHSSAQPDASRAGLMTGSMNLSGGHTDDRNSPLEFLVADGDAPVHYEYDFERSGSKNFVIENGRLRLILLPAADGQISALVDKQNGVNLTTTAGGLREFLRLPDHSLADPLLNVPFSAEWLADKDNGAVRMSAHWPAGSAGTGEIVKTVRMSSTDGQAAVDVEYQFHPDAAQAETAPGTAAGAAVVTAFSVPATAIQPDATKFCWYAATGGNTQASGPSASGDPPASVGTCATFAPEGDPIIIPPDSTRLEVRTPGRPVFGMEWSGGRVTLEQKRFSARILLELPANAATGEAGSYDLRYTVGPVQ